MQTVFFGNFLMQLSAAPTGQRQRETKLKAKEECIYFLLLAFVGINLRQIAGKLCRQQQKT